MGGSSWSSDSYRTLKSSYSSKSADDIFTSKSLDNKMSPNGVKVREARDSAAHPESLAVMVWLDETGSMGDIPLHLVKEELGSLMDTLIKNNIADPSVFFGGIGDHITDNAPLQVGQFESGTTELNEWLTKIYIEGNGGGQKMESYLLAWYFAARHTSIDCFEKRNQRGFLFTIGDEKSWDEVSAAKIKDLMGLDKATKFTDKDILEEAEKRYHVFHLHANQANHRNDSEVINYWKKMLGERCIIMEDYKDAAKIIASTVAVFHGVDLKDVIIDFDIPAAERISQALMHVGKDASVVRKGKEGIVKL